MTAYRERGTDRLHLVDAEPAEVLEVAIRVLGGMRAIDAA